MRRGGRRLLRGARGDLGSDFYRRRETAITEEASLLWRRGLSSIKHQDLHKTKEKV